MKRSTSGGARRGFSLVELLATITILTILLTLCAGLIKLLLKLDRSGRDAMAVATDQVRLARTFREDVHRSTSPTPAINDASHLRLAWPGDERVDYTIRPQEIVREVRQGTKVRQREFYRCPPQSTARFEGSTEAAHPLVSIIIHRDRPGLPLDQDDRCDAELGRSLRLIARQP